MCGGTLGFEYDADEVLPDPSGHGVIGRWWRRLPVVRPDTAISLGEGATPLLRSRLFPAIALHWKDESRNPTGSHKDRAMALALTQARHQGALCSVVVSGGSTGLANAAYAARAGIPSIAVMQVGAPRGRIYPLSVYGSRLIEVDAGIDDLIEAVRQLAGRDGIYVCSTARSSNPYQAEACKTIAYEIAEQLGRAPDWIVLPVGGGGTMAAIVRGFEELRHAGRIQRLPRMAAVVPKAYDALRTALDAGIADAAGFAALPYGDDVPTILGKLAHGHPPDGVEALDALRRTEGRVVAVEDDEAVAGTHRIAAMDGLYLEPSSGVVVPAIESLLRAGIITTGETVVALGCGSGFRETFVLAERGALTLEAVGLGELESAIQRK
jgi:threonine synthase